MYWKALLVTGLLAGCAASGVTQTGAIAPSTDTTTPDGWVLAWSDEFNGETLDNENWSVTTDCWGGGNEERQCYTSRPENVRVEGGSLHLSARLEGAEGPALPKHMRETDEQRTAVKQQPFTSGKISTNGHASWLYGRFEIRAKLPEGQGTWPALWMLPQDEIYGAWAASGEIDIAESVNRGGPCDICENDIEDRIYGTIHHGREWPHNRYTGQEHHLPQTDDGFHIFAVEWEEGVIRWYADGEQYFELTSNDWRPRALFNRLPEHAPFDQPFYLVLNLAIGGHLPEDRNAGGVSIEDYPKSLEVDWVRIYQRPDGAE